MPLTELTYPNLDAVPAALRSVAKKVGDTDQHTVSVHYGDNVAAELNPELARNRDKILTEKTTLENQHRVLLETSNAQTVEINTLKTAAASSKSVSADDFTLLEEVKKHGDLKTVSDRLKSVETLTSEITAFKAKETNTALFETLGYSPTSKQVFFDLIGNKDKNPNLVSTEVKTVDNKQIAYAKVKDANGVEVEKPLTDYIKDNQFWQPYSPLLQQGGGETWFNQQSANNNNNNNSVMPQNGGNPLVAGIIAGMQPKTAEAK